MDGDIQVDEIVLSEQRLSRCLERIVFTAAAPITSYQITKK